MSIKFPFPACRPAPASWSQVGTVGLRAGSGCPDGNFWRKSSHPVIPHYWNPQQVERLLDSLAALGLRRARVAALIMWRTGLRVGETVALEWRDIDVTAGSLLVRRGKGGRGRTVPLHPDLASLFANWPTSYGPRPGCRIDPEDDPAAPASRHRACRLG